MQWIPGLPSPSPPPEGLGRLAVAVCIFSSFIVAVIVTILWAPAPSRLHFSGSMCKEFGGGGGGGGGGEERERKGLGKWLVPRRSTAEITTVTANMKIK